MNEENLGYIKKETLVEIADAIRNKTGKTEGIQVENLANEINGIEGGEIPESINTDLENEINKLENRLNGGQEIESIYDQVYDEGYQKGVSDGQKTEYDRFWDSYQDYGNIADCTRIFGGKGWNDSIFKPKYSLKLTNANYMFSQSNIQDYKGILESQNVTFDFSNCESFYDFFWASQVTRIGEIDMRNATIVYEAFASCGKLISIDKVIFKNEPYNNASAVFYSTPNLEDVTIEGKIFEDPRLNSSRNLNKKSIISFTNALAEDATGKTCTFSRVAVNNAFETSTGLANGSTSQEWLDLIATKPNWTISLV